MPPLAALARLASSSNSNSNPYSYAPLPSWLSTAPSSPILSRTTKDGRPRWRRSWIVAFPALASLVVLLASWRRGNDELQVWEGPREMLEGVTDACKTLEVLEGRKQASFWVAEVSSSGLTIRPRSTSLASLNCPTLSSAYFTARLHFSNRERRLLLPAQPSAGIYTFPLLPPITAQPTAEVKVEVTLDSGWFPAGVEGLPCGDDRRQCDYDEMRERGIQWTEEEVKDSNGKRPSYRNRFRPLLTLPQYAADDNLPLCPSSLSYLPGSWLPQSHTYAFLDPQGSPCQLLSPTLYANSSHSPSLDLSLDDTEPTLNHPLRPKRWLRLLGDSNLRTLFHPFALSLGIDPATHCLAHQGTNDAHPTTLLCWSDELLLSFNWWFGNQGSKEGKHEGDARKLERLLEWSARDLLESVPWEKEGPWPSHFETFDQAAEAIFLSIGSHMPAETSLGMSALLEALDPVLSPRLADSSPSSLIMTLTSSTSPSRLPALYEPSRVMRNDLMIRATNSVLQRWAEERDVRTVDLYTMTRTGGKEISKDPVHFWDPIYQVWTYLFFHAWQTSLPSSPFLPSSSTSGAEQQEQGWEIVRLPPSSAPGGESIEDGFGVTEPLLMSVEETVLDG